MPKRIDENKVIERINPFKNVNGFTPINVGRMSIGLDCFMPATPKAIIELLHRYNISTSGKHCVRLGCSNIVCKPITTLMLQKEFGDATITVCHSHNKILKEECRKADIIVSSIGVPNFVTVDMIKKCGCCN